MSYKLDLSDITRDSDVSLTQQLVDRIVAAIDSGDLDPGEKLPTTRALADQAGINHLTAARVYRRLAELGYVTASVGRGTFVRTLAPAADERHGDDWQIYALPDRPMTYGEQILSDAFRLPNEPGMLSLSTGWPSPSVYPTEQLAQIAADVFREEGGNAISYLSAEGLYELREQVAGLRRRARLGDRRRRDHRDLGRPPGRSTWWRARCSSRATWSSPSRRPSSAPCRRCGPPVRA